MQFQSPLGPAAWAILAGIPVGIIALYFLKLRRRPVVVASTMLWRRSLEDLHVNSLFQRLRRNLLLFLQLLAIFLAMLALSGPRVKGTTSQGQRYILAIDNSASMSATDIRPTRLAEALSRAEDLIDGMHSTDLAMVIAFADRAEVVSSYTGNKALLRQRLRSIEPTQATTSLRDALEVAAGLANPASDLAARLLPQGMIATDAAVPPKLMIYTDGGFADVDGFSVGNLIPEVIVIGTPPPSVADDGPPTAPAKPGLAPSNNVAILALRCSRNDQVPDQVQVFGRVRNYRSEPVETMARLYGFDSTNPREEPRLLDAIQLKLGANSEQSFEMDLEDQGEVLLEVRLDCEDDMTLDNRAFSVFGAPRRARVLLVSEGNRYLTHSLQTPATAELADVEVIRPDELNTDQVRRDMAVGRYDLVIFEDVSPETPPAANTLYFGGLPPSDSFSRARDVEWPVVLDWDVSHPLMNYIRDLGLVRIAKARTIELPPGGAALMETQAGPVAFTIPREGFVDAVVGFSLIDGDTFNSDWMVHRSFPIFLYNAIRHLGNAQDSSENSTYSPNSPITLRADPLVESIVVTAPNGRSKTLDRTPQGAFMYNDAHSTGIYQAAWGDEGTYFFAVNLFDPRESDLSTRGMIPQGVQGEAVDAYKIKIGYTAVEGTRRSIASLQNWWKPLAISVLVVLILEWFIYNRRIYV